MSAAEREPRAMTRDGVRRARQRRIVDEIVGFAASGLPGGGEGGVARLMRGPEMHDPTVVDPSRGGSGLRNFIARCGRPLLESCGVRTETVGRTSARRVSSRSREYSRRGGGWGRGGSCLGCVASGRGT